MSSDKDPPLDARDPEYEDFRAAIEARRRDISDDQLRRFEGYAAEMFGAFGMDLDTPSTKDTPRRFIRALIDSTQGYDGDPKLLKGSRQSAAADRTALPARLSKARSTSTRSANTTPCPSMDTRTSGTSHMSTSSGSRSSRGWSVSLQSDSLYRSA